MKLDLMTVNLELVAASDDISSSVRRMAEIIIGSGGYASVGDVIGRLSGYDIEELLDIIESPEGDYEVILATLMLAKCEGLYPQNLDELQKMTGMFNLIIAGMGLLNRGLVKANMHNFTLSIYDEDGDKIIFYTEDDD
jgi:hypothetical protein